MRYSKICKKDMYIAKARKFHDKLYYLRIFKLQINLFIAIKSSLK